MNITTKILLMAAGMLTSSAFATSFTLNTGVSATTGLQLPANSPEERYTQSSPSYVFPSGTYPLTAGTWVANAAGPSGGQWISEGLNGAGDDPVGITTYSISFHLNFAQTITGGFTGDNPARLSLNNVIKITQPGWPVPDNSNNWADYYTWSALTPFTLNLPAGDNTVKFEVYNGGGPGGLIVNSSSVTVPEGGSTLLALGIAVVALGGFRRTLKTA